jgi:hypothetical protein
MIVRVPISGAINAVEHFEIRLLGVDCRLHRAWRGESEAFRRPVASSHSEETPQSESAVLLAVPSSHYHAVLCLKLSAAVISAWLSYRIGRSQPHVLIFRRALGKAIGSRGTPSQEHLRIEGLSAQHLPNKSESRRCGCLYVVMLWNGLRQIREDSRRLSSSGNPTQGDCCKRKLGK